MIPGHPDSWRSVGSSRNPEELIDIKVVWNGHEGDKAPFNLAKSMSESGSVLRK
jgi:hypothetical protein